MGRLHSKPPPIAGAKLVPPPLDLPPAKLHNPSTGETAVWMLSMSDRWSPRLQRTTLLASWTTAQTDAAVERVSTNSAL
jgi:hypothetical protein